MRQNGPVSKREENGGAWRRGVHVRERSAPEGRMPPGRAEDDRLPPKSENRGFRRNYFNFFGNRSSPNPSKFQILRNFVSLGTKIMKN